MAQQNDSRIDVFFYGLFMDEELLRQKGADPTNRRFAFVDDYVLVIGERATLVQREGERVYGVVFSLTQKEIDLLYSEPSVRDYRAELVTVNLADGHSIPGQCFNLPAVASVEKPNREYAAKLRALATRLGLPQSYVNKIQ